MDNSSAEWFDVVDGDDRVVGRATREEVHRRKLFHRAVHIFVFRAEGRMFLQRRSMSKDTAPGRWVSSCSGHVDAGEDYLEAARREMAEEIGIADPQVRLEEIDRVPAVPETGHEFVRVYRVSAFEGELVLDPEEIAEGCWRSPQEIDAWVAASPEVFSRSFVYLWERLRGRIA